MAQQLSEQLAALLREKESMLEEFKKRALELEKTVLGEDLPPHSKSLEI